MANIIKFVVAMIVSFLPGIFGAMFAPMWGGDAWFGVLAKSVYTPAGWVFGVAWIILYFVLGIALYLIISDSARTREKIGAYAYFVLHMILNFAWTYVFFGCHMPVLALIILAVLILVAFWMMGAFMQFSKLAGWLVLPYILWMLFAAYLNGVIVAKMYHLNGVVGAVSYISSLFN